MTNDFLLKFFSILLIGLIVLPVFANDSTPVPVVSGNDVIVETVDDSPAGDSDSFWSELFVSGFDNIVVGIALIVLAWVAIEGLRGLKVSMPPGTVQPYVQPIADNLQRGVASFQENAEQTPGLIDDVIGNVAKMSSEQLIGILEKQGYVVISGDDEASGVFTDIGDGISGLVPVPVPEAKG